MGRSTSLGSYLAHERATYQDTCPADEPVWPGDWPGAPALCRSKPNTLQINSSGLDSKYFFGETSGCIDGLQESSNFARWRKGLGAMCILTVKLQERFFSNLTSKFLKNMFTFRKDKIKRLCHKNTQPKRSNSLHSKIARIAHFCPPSPPSCSSLLKEQGLCRCSPLSH